MSKIAVFPGSFDPLTLGHIDIITRAVKFFDTLYVAVGSSNSKGYLMSLEERVKVAEEVFAGEPNIKVIGYTDLTVDLCQRLHAGYIIRGLRSGTDFDYEKNIAEMNFSMDASIETVLLISRAEYAAINASIVREIWKFGGDVTKFVPEKVSLFLQNLRKKA